MFTGKVFERGPDFFWIVFVFPKGFIKEVFLCSFNRLGDLADQSSGALDRFAFLRRCSRFIMSFRIAGDSHLGFVSSLIRFRWIGAFASMASLRREYQKCTNVL